MPYIVRCKMEVDYIGTGLGPQTVPMAQSLTMFVGYPGTQGSTPAPVQVPGGETPSQANFNTAISGDLVTALEAQIAANLAQIQLFSTGGG